MLDQAAIDNADSLSSAPATGTAAQRRRIVLEGRRRGLDLDELRDLAGGRLRAISCRAASALIRRLTGSDLPHAPGCKPRSYHRRRTSHSTRIILLDHVEQIERLLAECFPAIGNGRSTIANPGAAWLLKTFKVSAPADLLTAERAGEVIAVLKRMLARRVAGSATSAVPSSIDNRQSAIGNCPGVSP
jgi:hypothetical protein